MKKFIYLFVAFVLPLPIFAQEEALTTEETITQEENIFSLEEFLAMVKKHHPVVAQANLKISEAEAKLLKARGAFDPKLEGGMKEKNYHGTEYYSLWNGSFKVPMWYGIDLKADYEQNDGYYLNGQNTTPEDGIFSVGVSVRVLRGLLYNERMNAVKQGKILQNQNELERDILVNSILAEATKAYADWKLYYENREVYADFVENAEWGIKTKILDVEFIDSVNFDLEALNSAINKSGYETMNTTADQTAYDALPMCCKYDRNMVVYGSKSE